MNMKNGTIFILLTALAFGTMEISLKIAGNSFSPLQLTFLRFSIGGILLLPLAVRDIRKRKIKLIREDWIYLFALGCINICFSMILFQMGVSESNAGTAAIVFSVNPVFTMIISHFIVKDKFDRQKCTTIVFSMIGLTVVADPKTLIDGGNIGILITLCASLSFALYTTLGKLKISKIGGIAQSSLSFLMGSSVLLVVMLAKGEPVISEINSTNIGVLIYVSVVVTGLGYVCYMKAIELCGPTTASFAFFIKPIIALVLAAIILAEEITLHVVIGMILILVGCVIPDYINKGLDRLFRRKKDKN